MPIAAVLTPDSPTWEIGAHINMVARRSGRWSGAGGMTMASRADVSLWRETVKAGAVRSAAVLVALALLVATFVMALALVTYSPADSSLNTAGASTANNLLGAPGAWFADAALMLFGPAVALLLPIPPIIALRLWRAQPAGEWRRMARTAIVGVALMAVALGCVASGAVPALPFGWGGALGLGTVAVARWLLHFIDNDAITWWSVLALGIVSGVAGAIIWGRSLEIDFARFGQSGRSRVASRPAAPVRSLPRAAFDDVEDEDAPLPLVREPQPRQVATPDPRPAPVIACR